MPRTGELVHFRGAETTLVIAGPPAPPLQSAAAAGRDSRSRETAYVVGRRGSLRMEMGTRLYDDVSYTVHIVSDKRVPVTLGGRPLDVAWTLGAASAFGSCVMTFRQVGWLEILVGADPAEGIRLWIDSRKLDYETDYLTMVRDLENEVRGLVAKLVGTVLNPASWNDAPSDLWSHWVAIVQYVWEEMARDIQAAWTTLPPRLEPTLALVNLEHTARLTPHDAHRYVQSGRTKVMTRTRRWDPVIPERRYLLCLLGNLLTRLQRLRRDVPEISEVPGLSRVRRDAQTLLTRYMRQVQVERVSAAPVIPTSPLAQSHPALRRVIRLHRLVDQGLFPEAGELLLGVKNVSKLYEYWCYLAIVRILVEESDGQLMVKPQASRNPFDIVLQTGGDRPATVRTRNGQVIQILYERQYRGLPTVSQQPDHVVMLKGREHILLFDAKYRFEWDADNLRSYSAGIPIPPVDTINRMHQYHDAIVVMGAGGYQRMVDQAIVLFPLPRPHFDDFAHHRFRKSLDTIGVGALPLLPGGPDTYLRQVIRSYLAREDAASQLSPPPTHGAPGEPDTNRRPASP